MGKSSVISLKGSKREPIGGQLSSKMGQWQISMDENMMNVGMSLDG